MPLFLQALPLSLKTFWRYLAVLPALAIIAALLLLATFIPYVGLVVPGTVYAYCIMTGLRCALAARGHQTDPGFGHMLRAGLVFCGLTFLASLIIRIVVGFLGVVVPQWLGWLDGLADQDPRILAVAGGAFGATILLTMLWGAALAVPMTAAVAGVNPDSHGVNPFAGFGSGMLGLTLISLVWMAGGTVFSIFGEVATMFVLMAETLRAVIANEDPAWDWSLSPFSLLGGTLYMVWASSWFFSAAVLHWERTERRRTAQARARIEATRVSAADLRALREARMPRGDGGQG
jgi:hypothetical protein